MRGVLEVRTLTDGAKPWVAGGADRRLLGGARSTLDFAHYDFNLDGDTAGIVGGAIKAAAARGVAVRFIYNLDHRNPIPVPPPPEPDGLLIASLEVPVWAIAGVPDLMHHKYVVRDNESVWTGSTNWTEDSWLRQENVIVIAESRELAVRFTENFDELWDTGAVERSGFVAPGPVPVGSLRVGVVHAGQRRRPVAPDRQGDRTGAGACESPHRSSPRPIPRRSRRRSPKACSTSPAASTSPRFRASSTSGARTATSRGSSRCSSVMEAPFSGKPSTPWGEGTLHDFMHAKVTVADDTVFTGSFNCRGRAR